MGVMEQVDPPRVQTDVPWICELKRLLAHGQEILHGTHILVLSPVFSVVRFVEKSPPSSTRRKLQLPLPTPTNICSIFHEHGMSSNHKKKREKQTHNKK